MSAMPSESESDTINGVTILKYIELDMRTPNPDGCHTLSKADKRIATEVRGETVYFNMEW